MTSRSLLLSMLIVGIGCNEYEVKSTTEANEDLADDGEPNIEVNPMSITFTSLNAAEGSTTTEIVEVKNTGTADLHIDSIYLDDATGPFSIDAINTPLLAPNSPAQFAVTFAPTTAAIFNGAILIDSDDPDSPTVQVDLIGTGIAPIIQVTPTPYNFGTTYIGCEREESLIISNIGTDTLEIYNFNFATASTDLTFDSMESTYGDLTVAPWLIGINESIEVKVSYAPYDEINDEAFLTVSSNDPYTPETLVTQTGSGEIFAENQDMFEQPLKGMTDIIFALDRSCSMDDDIENVQANFGSFVETLSNMDADYHVAATVDGDGCINGPDLYIDNSFSSTQAISAITEMINLTGSYGGGGCPEECAFMQLEACISQALSSSGCNAGLVREDAKLALVGVSDEREQSTNTWSYYVGLFQGLKSDPDDVIIHAVGGDNPSGCGGNEAYTGMYEATMATGGLFLSICATDFGAHLEALAEGSAADLSSFPLNNQPVPETIIVKVNGITTTIGWEYDAGTNSIDFDQDHIPEGGSTIEVDYAVYGACE